jgi:PsbP
MNEELDQNTAAPDSNPSPNDSIYTVHEDAGKSFKFGYFLWITIFSFLITFISVTLVVCFELLNKPAAVQTSTLPGGIQYQSPNGYRLTYPHDWIIATQKDQQAITAGVKQLLGGVDFNRADVIIYNPQSYPMQNVEVVVIPESVPIDEEGLSEMESIERLQFKSSQTIVNNLEFKLVHVGNNDAISSTADFGFGSQTMHVQQLVVSGHGRSFIISCAAGTQDFAGVEPTFTQILNSFQVDESGWGGLPPWAQETIISAGVSIGIGILFALYQFEKKRS